PLGRDGWRDAEPPRVLPRPLPGLHPGASDAGRPRCCRPARPAVATAASAGRLGEFDPLSSSAGRAPGDRSLDDEPQAKRYHEKRPEDVGSDPLQQSEASEQRVAANDDEDHTPEPRPVPTPVDVTPLLVPPLA